MKTKKEELLEMLGRHGGLVTALHRNSEHETVEAAELREAISRGRPLPQEVWAAGFDHWRAEG